jgi:tetratricopeptide (TPR) repeat protein
MIKVFIIAFLVSCFASVNLAAQVAEDSAMYNEGISLLNKAKTTDNYLEAAFYFQNQVRDYPGQWLVYYYAGLAYIQASQKALTSNYKDELIDKAQPLIDKASALKPGDTEIQVLQAFLYQCRLQVNPQSRALTYSKKADACLKKALAADPENPRAYMLLGYNTYYTPAMLGGGPKNALPVFQKARAKFQTVKPAMPFFPSWGERENQQMIKECSKSTRQ